MTLNPHKTKAGFYYFLTNFNLKNIKFIGTQFVGGLAVFFSPEVRIGTLPWTIFVSLDPNVGYEEY
jgi:hypothetical protein